MDLINEVKERLLSRKFLFNKYVIVLAAFICWISFFDHFSLIGQGNLSRTVSKLEKEKQEYIDKLAEAEKNRDIILNDKEKFAREEYNFHKDNEEVILIPTKEKTRKNR